MLATIKIHPRTAESISYTFTNNRANTQEAARKIRNKHTDPQISLQRNG